MSEDHILIHRKNVFLPYMELKSIASLDDNYSNYFFSSVNRNLRIPVPNGKDRIIEEKK
jgi:hypothetical protein